MKNIKYLIPVAVLALLSIACSPHYYIPNTQNVPLIKAQGQTNITVAGNGNQFELQGAYGITDHLAIQANGGFVFPKNEDNGNGGSGKLIEGGIGYYTNISPVLLFDVYALFGVGTMENHFPTTLAANPSTTGKIEAKEELKQGQIKSQVDGLGDLEQTVIIADSNKCRMNRNFPYHFLECSLSEANLFGWLYAIGRCRFGSDKVGFHAIGAIGGIDGKP